MNETNTTKLSLPASRDPLFGPPPVITGEDEQAYNAFYARIAAAVKPKDFLEDIWTVDVADCSWDVLRLRRIKALILSTATAEQLSWVLRDTELTKKWCAGNVDTRQKVELALVAQGSSTEAIAAKAFQVQVDMIDRIDLMIMRAEARRNAALREVERHRWSMARALREACEAAIDAEFEEVPSDQPPKTDQAA